MTPEEKIQQEAIARYPIWNESFNNIVGVQDINKHERQKFIDAAMFGATWMKQEKDKEIAALKAASKELIHLHMCEQEGIESGKPTPRQWMDAVYKLSELVNK